MAVDGFLNFDTKINTKGFDKGTKSLNNSLSGLNTKLVGLAKAAAAAFSVKQIAAFTKSCKDAYQVQFEAEARLDQVMRNTMGATNNQIKSIKNFASELQKIGVIGDEVTLSGLQELGTYVENADSLKTMSVVLDDMLAQQYGLNATAENAVAISTMLGKVLEGQTSALSRYGYKFDEAQEKLLKYGTEEQRVATLAEVVEASVGGMNEALARTPAGRLKQISNNMGDVKEQFGKAFTNIQALFLPTLERLAATLARVADLAVRVSESLANVFGISLDNSAAVTGSISASVDAQDALTEAVKETNKAQKNSLAGFDKINTLATQTVENTSLSSGGKTAVKLDETPAEKKLDKLAEKLKELAEPIRLAWESNEEQLTANVQRALLSAKGLISEIGSSLKDVWTNGSGERYVSNILTLFGDVLGVIGDISEALEKAWSNKGTAFVQSFADRWNSFLELLHTFIDSFRSAWNEDDTGESILEHIIGIFTQYNNIFKNLRTSIKEAWEENEVGERIFGTILKFIDSIADIAERAFKATADWAADIDFYPLIESVESLLEALSPLGERIGEGLLWFYQNVILPFAGCVIEKALPVSIDVLAAAIEALDPIVDAFMEAGKWLWESFLKPLGEWAGDIAIDGLKKLADILREIGDYLDEHPQLKENLGPLLLAGGATAVGGKTGFSVAGISMGVAAGKDVWDNRSDIWDTIKEEGSLQKFNRSWISDALNNAGLEKAAGWLQKIGDFFDKTEKSPFFDIWTDFWGGIGEKIADVKIKIDDFKQKWTEFWEGIGEKIADFKSNLEEKGNSISEWFSEKWEGIKQIFSPVTEWFSELFSNAWNGITDAWSGAVGWFSDIWENIKKAFSNVGSWFKERFEAARNNIKNAWNKVGEWFSNRRTDVESAFSDVGSWFKERFETAKTNVQSIWNGVGDWFGKRWEDIQDKFKGVGSWFRDRFQAAKDNIVRIFGDIGNWFGERWEDIVNGLHDGINWAIEKINGLLWRLEDGINSLAGNSPVLKVAEALGIADSSDLPYISIPQIPYLAQGTVVPANYGNFLAMLGDNKREAEVVSPLSTIEKAVANVLARTSGEQTIHVHVELDGREIGHAAVKAVNNDNARKGR